MHKEHYLSHRVPQGRNTKLQRYMEAKGQVCKKEMSLESCDVIICLKVLLSSGLLGSVARWQPLHPRLTPALV